MSAFTERTPRERGLIDALARERRTWRFEVYVVRRSTCEPVAVARFVGLELALAYRDERRAVLGPDGRGRVHWAVRDADDPERGDLEWGG